MAMIIKKMAVRDWIDVPDNPRQRDTVRHAKKAKRTHLATNEVVHMVVFAAMVNGDVRWKLDGHTRAFLWENGELPMPRGKLVVVCFEVRDAKEAKRLYSMFDNQAATENAGDRLSGACREHKLALASPLLRSHKFVVALQCASGEKLPRQEYELVKVWKAELEELDSWDLSAGMHTALIALALVLIANNNTEKAREFFEKFDKDEGTKTDKGRDGVQTLTEHFASRQAERTTAGWDNIEDLFQRAYSCFAAYAENRRLRGGPRATARKNFAKVSKVIRKAAAK